MSFASLPLPLRRRAAATSHDAAWGLRNDEVHREQSRCHVCGLCMSTGAAPTATCTLFDNNDVSIVHRQQTDICKALCIGREPLRMVTKFIRLLVMALHRQMNHDEGWLRMTLQRDDPSDHRPAAHRPYLLDVFFSQGEDLQLTFMKEDIDDEQNMISIGSYHAGDEISLRHALSPGYYDALKNYFHRAFVEGDGQPHSLVVQSTDLPRRDVVVNGILLQYHGAQWGEYSARPVFLFVQAH